MSVEWTPLHEWIAQFLMDDGTFALGPCEMAYRIVDRAGASGMSAFGQDPKGLEAKSASPTADLPNAIAERDERIERLEKALERAEFAMTCGGGEDKACYCPNCDTSFYSARDDLRTALERSKP